MSETMHRHRLPDGREFVVHDRVLFGLDAEVATFVQMRLGEGLIETLGWVALGVLRNDVRPQDVAPDRLPDQLAAGVIYWGHRHQNDWSNIYASVATGGDSGLAFHPDVIARVLYYPFRQLKVRRITLEIEVGNEASIRAAEALGFVCNGILDGMGPGGTDVALYGLRSDKCRFLMREAA